MAAKTETPQRCAIYGRVSTTKQENDGTSLETQVAACRAFCADHGYVVAAVFREVFTGAELYARPELAAARQAIRHGAADVLLCYAVDRLARKQAHVAIVSEEVEQAGGRLEFVTEDFERSAVGEFIRSAKAFAAEVEREKTAERTLRGTRARAERGAPVAGCRPLYGYRWVDEVVDGRLIRKARFEIDPITGSVVRRIFRDLLDGASLRAITLALTAEEIPTPMGKDRWAASTLNYLLSNRTYTGMASSFGYRIERLPGNRRRVHRRPVDEQLAMPEGTVPPLITIEEFEAVQARLAANKSLASRNNRNPEATLLRGGFARCGYCGHPATVNNAARGRTEYRCQGWAKDEHGCPSYGVQAAPLDAEIWRKVEAILTNPQTIADQVTLSRERDPVAADLVSVDRRLATIGQQQQRISRSISVLDDDDAAAPLLAQLKALAAEKRHLAAERGNLEAQRAGWQAAHDRLADLAVWCRRLAGNLPTLTYAEKRDLLTALDVRVALYRVDHSPRWEITMGLDGIVSETASVPQPRHGARPPLASARRGRRNRHRDRDHGGRDG